MTITRQCNVNQWNAMSEVGSISLYVGIWLCSTLHITHTPLYCSTSHLITLFSICIGWFHYTTTSWFYFILRLDADHKMVIYYITHYIQSNIILIEENYCSVEYTIPHERIITCALSSTRCLAGEPGMEHLGWMLLQYLLMSSSSIVIVTVLLSFVFCKLGSNQMKRPPSVSYVQYNTIIE